MILKKHSNDSLHSDEALPKVLIYISIIFQVIIGTTFFLYATEFGLHFTHDSYYYYSAAKSLLADGTLKNPSGDNFTNWPPLYPFILYILNNNLAYIKAFHCVIYVLTLIIPILIASRIAIQKHFFILYVLIQTFSVTLISYQIFLLSEGVFVVLNMLLFCVWMKYDKHGKSWLFLTLIVLSNLLCLQRMMGVYIVVIICISLLLKKEYLKSIFYGSLSIIGLTLWVLIKQIQSHQPLFTDNIGMSDRVMVFRALLIEISKLFVPTIFSAVLNVCIGLTILLCCIYFYIKTSKQKLSIKNNLFFWVFLYFFLIVAAGGSIPEIDRFAMPIFPFLLLQTILSMDHYFRTKSRLILNLIMVFACYWILYTSIRMYKNVTMWHTIKIVQLTSILSY